MIEIKIIGMIMTIIISTLFQVTRCFMENNTIQLKEKISKYNAIKSYPSQNTIPMQRAVNKKYRDQNRDETKCK